VTKKPAHEIGVHRQSSEVLAQLKENLVVESAKVGFDEALLSRVCTLDPEIEGAAVSEVPGSKESYRIGDPFHSAFNKIEVFFGQIARAFHPFMHMHQDWLIYNLRESVGNITELICELPVPIFLHRFASASKMDQDEPGIGQKIACRGKLEVISVVSSAQERQFKKASVSQPVHLADLTAIRFQFFEFVKLGLNEVFIEPAREGNCLKCSVIAL
jgi:hypothetical protein